MRTTVDLPDELYRQAKAKAALRGRNFKDLVEEGLRRVLRAQSSPAGEWRHCWPDDPKMEALREAWFEAPDQQAWQKICRRMQEEFWLNPSYVPLGLWYQPTAFRANLQDVRDGWPQF